MNNISKKAKVTIIMPAYNAEKYIESSIESILNQTYLDLELIVVDDGSLDHTANIVNDISKKDNRVHLMSIDNSGPANARNVALDSLDGSSDYIMFCDADDLMKPDMVDKLVSEGEKGAELVLSGFSIVNSDGTKHDYFEPDMAIDINTIGEHLGDLYKANLLNQVWGKLFRSDIIFDKTIRFPNYMWGEDRFFVFDYINSLRKLSILSYCGYEYIMHSGQSLINSFIKDKPDICILIDERMEELCHKFGVKNDEAFRYMFTKSIFSCMATLYSPNCKLSHADKRNYIWSIISDKNILARTSRSSGGKPIKIISWVMNSGSISLNLFLAYLSSVISRISPEFFRKLKHKK